ncbi:cysteine desulfurase CsdA [Vibrio aestuarianus]|uniref:Probable cysteine desulfurase n=1 Tax=Vibrio aestuarianus TaxID=28171 RepID=A0A9X4J351_9VIBR|nr:cysteine desulfurase CsdA [Vibrio aestuarianus]MDE1310342.1 cysteine desulfurase CsdA [Vibrio aestuarianus]MDE1356451.1 cysteine desulfurase CsdA [Vibrio aestuarianus]NGZ17829.1 cysteine desulfurase CsdA [Vibrio aestuarianus]NGZ92726.1 cysteine desulfurase CsdA [Vibrio aestuarianus subsp. cardii]
MFDVQTIREQFPALKQSVNGETLVYLDSAATTQKPQIVIDTLTHYYSAQNANVHRGSHSLTAQATNQFEAARDSVAQFIGAQSSKEIIWTRGATEALNLIAQTYARNTLKAGDEILVSEMEHHANIVPWQIVAQQTGAKVVKIPMTADCQFDQHAFNKLLTNKTKIVAIAQVTNVTGTRQPIEAVIELAHQVGAIVVIDGAQGVVHESVNVAQLQADFYVFSGHKIYAPAGIGVLYGKLSLLESMPPWHGGGKMVEKVSFDGTTYSDLPGKFEAGTPNVAGAIALAKAIEWYQACDRQVVEAHLHHLQALTYQALQQLDDIRVVGYQPHASVISFVMEGVHHQDIATLLDQQGIALRAGHHCAHPLMDALGLTGTVRISFGVYNNEQDVEKLITALTKAIDML